MQAIPTRYAGHHFRSRQEARWAVCFDHLGLRWEYEPEGVMTPHGPYLVDFIVTMENGERYLWEVKPLVRPQMDDKRWGAATLIFDLPMIVSWGMPRPDEAEPYQGAFPPHDFLHWLRDWVDADGTKWESGDQPYCLCTCPKCGKVGVEFDGRGGRVCGSGYNGRPGCTSDDKGYTYDSPRILAAYAAAHSARFEHGQSGPT